MGLEANYENLRKDLSEELEQFNRLSASFFRAAAARIGMTVTDMQALELLASTGPMTAGQLADFTGLTTGAVTGMLNRMEEVGFVRRERDPNDSRKVIVRLEPGKDAARDIGPIFDSIAKAWDGMAAQYDDAQLAFLLDFLKRSNTIARTEIVQLRDAPSGEEGIFSAPLGSVKSGRLAVSPGISQLTVRSREGMTDLYQARFEGPVPSVKDKEGVVTLRYPRRLWVLGGEKRVAEVMLNVTIPWWIVIQGGASDVVAELSGLDLAGMEVIGGASSCRLELPTPTGMVPIKISGGALDVTVRRPKGVAARVHLKGWVSQFIFDDRTLSGMGNDVRLESPGYAETAAGYDIEVSSSASMVTITTV